VKNDQLFMTIITIVDVIITFSSRDPHYNNN